MLIEECCETVNKNKSTILLYKCYMFQHEGISLIFHLLIKKKELLDNVEACFQNVENTVKFLTIGRILFSE